MMRLLFKMSRKLVVLAFAGFGAYKAWEMFSAGSNGARAHLRRAKTTIGSAVRQAEEDVKDASQGATGGVIDASRIAVAEVAEAVADAALDTPAGQAAGNG